MCNISSYIGGERAAPILIDMFRRQEGFDSGFAVGIATVDGGRIHMRKVEGNLENLLSETDAMDLPGNVGFIHGRTPGTGKDKWAHPFMGCGNEFALCENGCSGYFDDAERFSRISQELHDAGHELTSLTDEKDEYHPALSDGRYVHCSDMLTHYVCKCIKDNGGDVAMGMKQAFEECPLEVVALLLHENYDDRIFITRINMPMMVARNGREVFTSSAALAFPKDRGINWVNTLPVYSTCVLTCERIEIIPLEKIQISVDQTLPWKAAEEAIIDVLKEHKELPMGQLRPKINHIWPEGVLVQRGQLLYQLLPDMERRGVIKFRNANIPGNHPPLKAPSVMISLSE